MPSKSSGKSKKQSAKGERKRSSGSERKRHGRSGPPGPVMGLDLSMAGCGVSVVKGKKVLFLDRFQTAPVGTNGRRGLLESGAFLGTDEERIAFLAKKIRKTMVQNAVCFVAIEGHAFGAKGRSLTILHELHGVVKHYLLKDEMAFVTVQPNEVKKFATGNGRADKQEMIHAANEAGLDHVKDSDRADRFWVSRYGWDQYEDLVET